MTASPAERLALLDPDDQATALDGLTDDEAEALLADWQFWGRPEQRWPEGDWTLWGILGGRGSGKAVPMSTPVATPSGWVTMGDLDIGTRVFDEHGEPCTVTAVYDQGDLPGWRFRFSDGAEIVACDDHQWVTWTHRDRKSYGRTVGNHEYPPDWTAWCRASYIDQAGRERPIDPPIGPQIRTTRQIRGSIGHCVRGDLNHSIPLAGPLRLPAAVLPMDPWVLGYWLGNGDSAGPTVHTGSKEGDTDAGYIASRLRALGIDFSQRDGESTSRLYMRGMVPTFRALDLIKNKHVPDPFLWGSIAQRLGLLQGLCDSDGYVDPQRSAVEFTSTREGLADAVLFLARSVGERPTISEGRAMLNGRDCGPKWRVNWTPVRFNPFTLPRKAAGVSLAPRPQGMRRRARMIASVEATGESVPMRCITVDSPSAMFLLGHALIPTHNTRPAAEFVLDRSIAMHEADAAFMHRVATIGRTAGDVRDVMLGGESGLEACAARRGIEYHHVPSRREWTLPGLNTVGTTFSAAEPEQSRGHQFHTCWSDEVAAWVHKVDAQGNTAWTNLRFGLRLDCPAPYVPQMVASTTPKPIPLVIDWFVKAGMFADPATGEIRAVPDPSIVMTQMSMYDNLANLAPAFIETITDLYGGTRLGDQEIMGLLLASVEGALWQPEDIDHVTKHPPLGKVVVSVDPSGSAKGAECGIIVAGSALHVEAGSRRRHAYVLDDLSVRGRTEQWAGAAVAGFRAYHAHEIVVEQNYGGDMARAAIHAVDPSIPMVMLNARGDKATRAQPVTLLYQQHRVHHFGQFGLLESQQLTWADEKGQPSPDRLDALVHAIRRLFGILTNPPARSVSPAGVRVSQSGGGSIADMRLPRSTRR